MIALWGHTQDQHHTGLRIALIGTHTGPTSSHWVEDSSMGAHPGPTSYLVEDSAMGAHIG